MHEGKTQYNVVFIYITPLIAKKCGNDQDGRSHCCVPPSPIMALLSNRQVFDPVLVIDVCRPDCPASTITVFHYLEDQLPDLFLVVEVHQSNNVWIVVKAAFADILDGQAFGADF